jgi:hypothetical protein
MVRRGFHKKRRAGVELRLTEPERAVRSDLLGELADWLQPAEPGPTKDPLSQLVGIPEAAERPTDPALLRLFPDAYDDADEAADFRRFTEPDLRQQRAERTLRARATLTRVAGNGRIPMHADEAQDWLTTLNDVRLVLGTRLGVTEEAEQAADQESQSHAVYDWLTWLQATLVEALLP